MSILNNFITVVNPDGTISYFPNTLQSEPGIPFTSTVDMKDMNSGLFSNFDQSPTIVDRAREINEILTGEYDPEADDLFNQARRRNLFATNFQDQYYLDSILNQNAANKAAMDVFKQGFRNQNMMNQGIMNQAPSMFLDDAGLPAIDTSFGVANEPDVEEDVEKAKRSQTGIGSLINILRNIPTPLNLLRRGISALGDKFGRPGIRGGVGLRGDLMFDTFGRSTSLADFLQRRRDKKAREEAARIGAEKQKAIIASQQVDTGGGPGSRPGGFGQGAGDFSPSDPTATEGSF